MWTNKEKVETDSLGILRMQYIFALRSRTQGEEELLSYLVNNKGRKHKTK